MINDNEDMWKKELLFFVDEYVIFCSKWGSLYRVFLKKYR